jgi:hypothetical protein
MSQEDTVLQVITEARKMAAQATQKFLEEHGDHDACGFAWITVYEKGNTRLGRSLLRNGFSKAYGGGLQLWNPSDNMTQSISALEAGADAAARVFRERIPGIKTYAGSRLD